MSDNGTINGIMSDNGTRSRSSDRRQVLHHDLRHVLFTLRTGIALLGHVREDPERFAEVEKLLQLEITSAAELVEELLGHADSPAH